QQRRDGFLRREFHRLLLRRRGHFRHTLIRPRCDHLVRKSLRITGRYEKSVHAVSDQLFEARTLCADHYFAQTHRFQTRIRQVVDQRRQDDELRSSDHGIQLTVRQLLDDYQSLAKTIALRPRESRHRRREGRFHVSANKRDVRVRTVTQKARQGAGEHMKSFVQLKATEEEHVFPASQESIVNSRI